MSEEPEFNPFADLPSLEALTLDGKVLLILWRSGIRSPIDLLLIGREKLASLGLSASEVDALLSKAKAILPPILTQQELLEHLGSTERVTTGSKYLDELIGKVPTRAVTEFAGPPASGKTQLCHQMAVNAQLPPESGGLGGKVLFIDAEGTFRPERIASMATALSLEPKEALRNILYTRANSTHRLFDLVSKLEEICSQRSIKLLVIDTISSLFRAEFPDPLERARQLGALAKMLILEAARLDVAVVVTNQVYTLPSEGASHEEPVGSAVLGHIFQRRVQLRRISEYPTLILATLTIAPDRPVRQTLFAITDEGVRDGS